jgi:transposase
VANRIARHDQGVVGQLVEIDKPSGAIGSDRSEEPSAIQSRSPPPVPSTAHPRVGRRRCPGFDRGEGPRRWRALDLGSTVTWLEAESPTVSCPEHGVVVTAVPWARHGARFTTEFEDQVAWLVARSAQSTVAVLLRISWRSVAAIVTRVVGSQERGRDLFANLQRIGIDEPKLVLEVTPAPRRLARSA